MKILYLCPDAGVPVLGRKGASVHVRELIAGFNRAGHNVILAAPVLNKSPWEKPETVEATLLQVKPSLALQHAVQAAKDFCHQLEAQTSLASELRRILFNQEFAADLERRFDQDPPDFIYERASLFGAAGLELARALRVPLLVELNAPLAVEQSTYRGSGLKELAAKAEQHLLTRADAVLTVSSALREHVLGLGAQPEKVHVLPNGVNPASFHPAPRDPELRSRWGLHDEPTIGFLGGLRPWHGIETLPELLQRLLPAHPDVQLVIAGDGQLRAGLESELEARGLKGRAIFTGAIPHEQAAAVIRQFDIALAPYPLLDHAFYFSPLKLFEYMACGVAVVAADLGQISEVLQHGHTGLLYRAGDLDGLVAACHRLLSNPKERFLLGQEASRVVLGRFTWDCNAARVMEMAQGLILAAKNPNPSTPAP